MGPANHLIVASSVASVTREMETGGIMTRRIAGLTDRLDKAGAREFELPVLLHRPLPLGDPL